MIRKDVSLMCHFVSFQINKDVMLVTERNVDGEIKTSIGITGDDLKHLYNALKYIFEEGDGE